MDSSIKGLCAALILAVVLVVSPVTSLDVVNTQPVGANPQTLIVPDDYPIIEWAIGNATEGDTIFVKSGTYYNQSFHINKSLSLIGEDSRTTILRGNLPTYVLIGPGFPPNTTVVQVNANDIKISGFTITNAFFCISGNSNRTKIIGNNLIGCGEMAVRLIGCYNIIAENYFENDFRGIRCAGDYNNIIRNNMIRITSHAIWLMGSHNTISGNNLNDGGYGISIDGNSNQIIKNNITAGSNGIEIESGSYNIIYGNRATGNLYQSISITTGFNNTIYENHIANNQYGAVIGGREREVANNILFHNNFINNTRQVRTDWTVYGVNFWDNGEEGNYWSDYEDRYPDAKELDGLGIWDTPYVIDENNQDNYPLMNPVPIPAFPDTTPPTISIVSPENKTYTANNVSLIFTVNELTSWIGYSLDGQANVTVTGNTTITGLSDGSHSLKVYAKDTAGNTGTSETIYFSIKTQQSAPFPTTWIVAAIVLIAVIGAALLVYFVKVKKTAGKAK